MQSYSEVDSSAIKIVEGLSKNRKFTAETFLNFLRPSNDIWWKGQPTQSRCRWIFRGQSNSDWNLIPAGLRAIDSGSDNWKERARARLYAKIRNLSLGFSSPVGGQINSDSNADREASNFGGVIDESISQFCDLAKQLSFVADSETSSPISQGIIIQSPDGNSFTYCEDYNLIGLAQHHGIQTHLLDWSDNSIFATHFACMEGRVDDQKNIAVWALDEFAFVNNSVPLFRSDLTSISVSKELSIHRSSPINNQYLAAQKGVFSYYGKSKSIRKFYKLNQRWPGIDELLDKAIVDRPVLMKVILQSKHVPKLRELIDREQITKAHLMPTLDNVVETVTSRW